MADLFSISRTGLSSLEKGISTASHNIANATTEGYSRQRVTFSSNTPSFEGGQFFGAGVSVSQVARIFNGFIEEQIRVSESKLTELNTFYDSVSQLDILFSDPNTSISNTMSDFYNAVNELANEPANSSSRESLLVQGERLSSQFRTLHNQLATMMQVNENAIKQSVDEASLLSINIADANKKISTFVNPSPDLLDQRDRMLMDLSKIVAISSFEQDDGAVNVFMSSGESLVVGGVATTLTSVVNPDDPTKIDVSIITDSGTQRINSNSITGGALGAYLSMRDGIIDEAIHMMGRLALGMAMEFNQQHNAGVDLTGKLGGDFFADVNQLQNMRNRVIANTNNTGNSALTVEINDISKITNSDYRLIFNGEGSFSITRISDGETTTFGSIPAEFDGFTIDIVDGALKGGDQFLISPTRFAARNMRMNIASASAIAAASPVIAIADVNNAGNAKITGGEILDITSSTFATKGQISPPVKIEFLTEATYRLINAATNAVIQPGPINYNPAVTNAIFPAPAIHIGATPGLVDAGSLSTLDSGDLKLNGIAVAAATADGVSPATDAAASGLAIAKAVNAGSTVHGVVATVGKTTVNLGLYTPAALAGLQFQINGQAIEVSEVSQAAMLDAIGLVSDTTGVTAALNNDGEMVLTAADGRNIQITTSGDSASATFANFSLTSGALDKVARSAVTLTSATADMVIAGDAPEDAGFTADTYELFEPNYRFSMSGQAKQGDTFTIDYNANGSNDGTNALSLLALQNKASFSGGTATANGLYREAVIRIGSQTNQVSVNKLTVSALQLQLIDKRNSLSGVNLDEEAVNLMKFEQAYKANSEVIAIARKLFELIFEAIG